MTQEDLENDGDVYQLEFCSFKVTEEGVQDFSDTRKKINYGIYELKESVLWQNNNEFQEFQAQTLKSDTYKGFKKIKIIFYNRIAISGVRIPQMYSQEVYPSKSKNVGGANLIYTDISAENIIRVWKRDVYYNTKTGEIIFGDGDLNNNTQNNIIIPIKIIGYLE